MKDYNLCFLGILVLWICVSCEEIIFEEDISDERIELLAPLNNTQVHSSSVNFNWTAIQDSISYRIQIVQPGFTDAQQLLLDAVTTETQMTVTLEDGTYEWRVQGFNSAYETSYTTAAFEVSSE